MIRDLMVFEPGEKFATMTPTGEARVFEVDDDGLFHMIAGTSNRPIIDNLP